MHDAGQTYLQQHDQNRKHAVPSCAQKKKKHQPKSTRPVVMDHEEGKRVAVRGRRVLLCEELMDLTFGNQIFVLMLYLGRT